MCGLAGKLNLDLSDLYDDNIVIKKVSDSIKHRGPDSEGFFVGGPISLVHRRLSIIDLSENGNQPFYSNDKQFVITFNGEIFNYKELRKELKKRGEVFHTNSDTEVLLRLFIIYGRNCLEKLNGMFVFAIWDCKNKKLFIARDRIGVKPLYFSIYNNCFFFGSEPKALFNYGIPKQFNDDILDELILFKYAAGENTSFKNINRLLPGHFIEIENGRVDIVCWWNLSEKIFSNREVLPKNAFDWFEETFTSAVAYRTISDVPVGVMLSGGMDSSSIALALHNNGAANVSAFTVGFDDRDYDESHLARLVCKEYGLNFNLINLKENFFDELVNATILHDEPLVHQNDAHMLALARQAKSEVSVLLSGEGGDEFMGGYFRYKALKFPGLINVASKFAFIFKRLNKNKITNRLDKLSRYVSGSNLDDLVLFNASNIYPSDFKKFGIKIEMDKFQYRLNKLSDAKKLYPKEPARQAMYLDLFTHMSSVLDRNDRMTMGAGVECRVPFMDYRLMEMIPALPTNFLLQGKKGKRLLCNSIAKKLPLEVLNFKKLGFSIPFKKYFESDPRFLNITNDIQKGSLDNYLGKFNPISKLDLNSEKSEFEKSLSRQLIMLEIWRKNYLDK
jgi:asparagine synthase (glutamine-hydrolysing)